MCTPGPNTSPWSSQHTTLRQNPIYLASHFSCDPRILERAGFVARFFELLLSSFEEVFKHGGDTYKAVAREAATSSTGVAWPSREDQFRRFHLDATALRGVHAEPPDNRGQVRPKFWCLSNHCANDIAMLKTVRADLT